MSAPAFVPIGIISQFSVLGNSAVTGSTGTGTIVTGDVGSTPTNTITNFLPSTVAAPFTLHVPDDGVAQQARLDGIAAYTYMGTLVADATLPDDLTGQVITSGVYNLGAALLPSGATLTLNGPGLFIFKVASTLTTVTTSIFAGTATASQIFWQIGTSATIEGVNFRGSLFADASITIGDNTILTGRAIAGLGATGAVTMAGDGGSTIGGLAIAPPPAPPGPYIIQVNYTPQTTGCHTICYGQTSPVLDTPCCFNDVDISPAMVGQSRTIYIVPGAAPCITVSPVGPADGTYTYEGTVTACCGGDPVIWGPTTFVIGGV